MKIIISPAKVQNGCNHIKRPIETLDYFNKTKILKDYLEEMSSNDIAKLMKIKNKLLDETLYNIRTNKHIQHAITLYNGIVFKEINTNLYNDLQLDYMNRHLRILSAMYGVLKPLTGIQPYRLDMTMKPNGINLYQFWDGIDRDFENDTIVNLASLEFSKLISLPMINIHFKEGSDQAYKIVTVRAKKARGLMVDYLISNMIENIEDIKKFDEDGYSFREDLSDSNNYVFIKEL